MTKTRTASFQAIKTEILGKIKNGYWNPGDIIPGEESLAESYGCSRVTVNRALRELAEEGFVERRRKSGTRVSLNTSRDARVQIPIVREEIENKGATYRYELILNEEVVAPTDVCRKMNLQKGVKALHIKCLHLADEVPYQFEDRWINLDHVPAARETDFSEVSPNEWLVRKEPFSEAEHTFSAMLADEETANMLEIEKGDALFVVERRTWREKNSITSVKLSFPGASYKMTTRG
ncbi:UTRA domain-containing protein [Sneathiella glossodoripedis]|uniref:UTRA domain-containing protein n=1 Tax=Sneathiella glossodoripedis TaxID=418853 RepID=UPI0004721D06|nr:UTRA domain-containing protein [Sneathiella glossodoripedis]